MDKNKDITTATATAADGDVDRATHSHTWEDERPASDQPISTDKPYVWEDTPEGRAAQAEYEDDELPF